MLPDAGVATSVSVGVNNVPMVAHVAVAADTTVHMFVVATLPVTRQPPTFIALAELKPPATPATAAALASLVKSTNFGKAVAAKIPKMTMTTISSIRVKPSCLRLDLISRCYLVVSMISLSR